jgi:DNA repair photolyase
MFGCPGQPGHEVAEAPEAAAGAEAVAGDDVAGLAASGCIARGRGSAALNPANRFDGLRLHVLGEHIDEQLREHPRGVQVATVALPDESRSIINCVVDSPDLPFKWTINPYRGCEHGCIYCYARPTHEYLGMSCGLDFETKIMVKHEAPDMLRRELASPNWAGEPIAFSGVTDCYQPLEAKLGITRRLLEVCAEFSQPVSIVTKSHLVTRDIDLLQRLARIGATRVAISITTLDHDLAMTMEPRASSPRDRLRAIRELRDAGIEATVMNAPIIPGLNDREMPAVLEAAAAAGAVAAGWMLLRLPYQIKTLFLEWLQRCVPDKAARIEHLIRETRGGELSSSRFGERMRGTGRHAEAIRAMFKVYARRYGLDGDLKPLSSASFRRPGRDGQFELFS